MAKVTTKIYIDWSIKIQLIIDNNLIQSNIVIFPSVSKVVIYTD